MLNSVEYHLPEHLKQVCDNTAGTWCSDELMDRIWSRDASVWTGDDEAKWLGWLTIIEEELADVGKYKEFSDDIRSSGFENILLMGMGGSSLCPEVLAITFERSQFHILDSTVPGQVRAVENSIELEKTLFIVASKSGSTLEPNCFKQYFFDRLSSIVGRQNAGRQFVAITDPGSKMEEIAREDGFRHVFYGKPEIGGRFSALSAFGMTAAAAMGLNVENFLRNAGEMSAACRESDPNENPGAMLGLILGECQKAGRDKLTIFTSPEIFDLGAWLEQLIAESTGKQGVAIIPVDREPVLDAGEYGDDRIFVFLELEDDHGSDYQIRSFADAGHPVINITLNSIDDLGQEFFRWEFATAVAGAVMGINPFNQPDVESAKVEARKITDEYERTGKLPDESPFFENDEMALFTSEKYAASLQNSVTEQNAAALIAAHLDQISPGDYFALLAYVEMNSTHEGLLQAIRKKVLDAHRVATCLGFGPRFLHSTGQAYKGGPNSGVVLQISATDNQDLGVPGQEYSFGVVRDAQARGDFQVLIDRGRRALRIHLKDNATTGLERLAAII